MRYIIKPNRGVEATTALLSLLIVFLITFLFIKLLNYALGFNMVETITSAVKEILSISDTYSLRNLVDIVGDKIQEIYATIIFVFIFFYLSTVNRKVTIDDNSIEYTLGLFFIMKKKVPINELKDIKIHEKQVIGDMAKVIFYIENDKIVIPNVVNAHDKVEKITDMLKKGTGKES